MKINIPGNGPVSIYGSGMFVSVSGDDVVNVSEHGGPSGSGLLNEDGTYILNEDGTYILLEG
jgi:hypothetical protein